MFLAIFESGNAMRTVDFGLVQISSHAIQSALVGHVRTHSCSQTVIPVSCHRLAGLGTIARLNRTVKDAGESFLGSVRLVKRSKAA
jgi:hypothetical protein